MVSSHDPFEGTRLTPFHDLYDMLVTGCSPQAENDAWAALREHLVMWAKKSNLGHTAAFDIEDVVQDSLHAIGRKLAAGRLDPTTEGLPRARETFSGWVRGFFMNARRTVFKERETQSLSVSYDFKPDVLEDTDEPAVELVVDIGAFIDPDRAECLGDGLEQLRVQFPVRYEVVIDLFIRELSYAEVAVARGITQATARQHRTRGILFLREFMNKARVR